MYPDKAYVEWQNEAATLLKAIEADTKFEGPVSLFLQFYCTKPRTSKLSAPAPDIDNYAKGIMDAITKDGRFWNDDRQVQHCSATKAWDATHGVQAGVYCLIQPIDPLNAAIFQLGGLVPA